jgi:hypothetical protein
VGEVPDAGNAGSKPMPVLDEWNKLIKRYENGSMYLNNNSIPMEEREKWQDEYVKICKRLSKLMEECENDE